MIQKRVDLTMNFNRTWNDYKKGFGDFLIREFWLGLDKIQRLTQNKTENKLRVDLGVTANESVCAEYKWFGIGNEKALYQLHIGKFSCKSIYSFLINAQLLSPPLHRVDLKANVSQTTLPLNEAAFYKLHIGKFSCKSIYSFLINSNCYGRQLLSPPLHRVHLKTYVSQTTVCLENISVIHIWLFYTHETNPEQLIYLRVGCDLVA